MSVGFLRRSSTNLRLPVNSFFESLGRAGIAPIRLIKRGRQTHLGYLALVGGLLGFISITVHDLLREEIARLFTSGAIQETQFERMKFVVPSLVGILAAPVVFALAALPVREFRGDQRITLGSLIRLTPRAAVRSGSALVALALHSFRLLIPLFLLGLGYLFALEALGPQKALIGAVAVAACLIPSVWRFGAALVAPIVAVIANTTGRAAIAESKRRGAPKLAQIWFVLLVGAVFGIGAIIGCAVLDLVGYPRLGVLVGLVLYFLTALADLVSESAQPPQG